MRKLLQFALLVGIVIVGWKAWHLNKEIETARSDLSKVAEVLHQKEETLLGYTKYTTYVSSGKSDLMGQGKLITAQVNRSEEITQVRTESWLGLQSNAVVTVMYTAEYSFGYDVAPGKYKIVPSGTGLEIQISKPRLVAAPAVTNLKHQVLHGGIFTDPQKAVVALQEQALMRAKSNGVAMETDSAIVALCEKKLIETVRGFLSAKDGVKFVPSITVKHVHVID